MRWQKAGFALTGVVALTVGLVPASSFAATTTGTGSNLITNGCLSDPAVPSGYAEVGAGQSGIPGWTVGGENVAAIATLWEPAPGCKDSLDLNGNSSVSQTVSTTPGAAYVLRWEGAADARFGPQVTTMRVLWDGKLVSSPTYNAKGHTTTSMGWVTTQVQVTATTPKSVIMFEQNGAYGGPETTIGAVSLMGGSQTVNGFTAASGTNPYDVAERAMLTKIPATASVPASNPVCAVQALAANQVLTGAGLQLVWNIAPTDGFIHAAPAAREAGAAAVAKYLMNLLRSSKRLYVADLQADRVPLPTTGGLANWWAVRVQSVSTTGALMSFQIALTKSGTTTTWANVPSAPVAASQAMAPEALANLLYYSKTIAAA
ncbi:MAG TPA: DUF642 domain-containing protein [Acidimicrobiales bacterium]|nr:DUF642 domain-containing protein [Acidimicrobiales bacterium]